MSHANADVNNVVTSSPYDQRHDLLKEGLTPTPTLTTDTCCEVQPDKDSISVKKKQRGSRGITYC